MIDTASVEAALGRVHDPCSLQTGAPLSVVDMGLVRSWRHDDDGTLTVRLCLTGPGCTLFPRIVEAATAELERLPGIRRARVELDLETVWTEDRLTTAGRDALARRRRASVERFALRRGHARAPRA